MIDLEQKATWSQQAWLWGMAISAIVLDQYTKIRVETIHPEEGFIRAPFEEWAEVFNYYHLYNTGAAFSLLEGQGWFFTTVAIIVSIILLLVNYTTAGDYLVLRVALGSVLGGALGNAIDRIRLGHVTDFINFNFKPIIDGWVENYPILGFDFFLTNWAYDTFANFPVFNWADIFVVSGVITMSILMLRDDLPDEDELSPLIGWDIEKRPKDDPPLPIVPVPDRYFGDSRTTTSPDQINSVSYTSSPTSPEQTADQSSDEEIARFGIWAIIIGGTILATLLFILFLRWRGRRRQAKRS